MSITQTKASDSIAGKWAEAQDLFFTKTKVRLEDEPETNTEGVLRRLDRRYRNDPSRSKDESIKSKTKLACLEVCSILATLSEYAEPILNAVYSPAGYCLKAVAFLLDAPGKINEVFASLTELFQAIQSFLSQLDILREVEMVVKSDSRLVEVTWQLMISFINMCALCYEPIKGGKLAKWKMALGAMLLNNDSGIHAELDNFRVLTERQHQIINTLNFARGQITGQIVEKQAATLETMNADMKKESRKLSFIKDGFDKFMLGSEGKEQQEAHQKLINGVAASLGIEMETFDKNAKLLKDLLDKRIGGTGEWLNEVDIFREWLDLKAETRPVLGLYGPARSGRSHLAAWVVSKVKAKVAQGARIAVAYYAFPKPESKTATTTRKPGEDPVFVALKTLALQIAQTNEAYAKELRQGKGKSDGGKGNNEAEDMTLRLGKTYQECWDALLLSSNEISIPRVFIIDGLDQLPRESQQDELVRVLSKPDFSSTIVRSFVTSERFRESSNNINIGQHILGDVMTLTRQWLLNESPGLESDPQFPEILETFQSSSISEEMDFNIIQSRVSRISSSINSYMDQATTLAIIRESPADESKRYAQQIVTGLEKSLRSDSVAELNELLIWVVACPRYMSAKVLEEALTIRGFATGAKNLRKKLTDRSHYRDLFEIDEDDDVVIRSNQLSDLLERKHVSSSSEEVPSERQISMKIQINQASIETIRSFLWELNHKTLFDKSLFDEGRVQTSTDNKISFNRLEACSIIIRTCLEVLTDDPTPDLNRFSIWAVYSLPKCLHEALKLEKESGEPIPHRETIVSNLITLLTEGGIAIKHWKSCTTPSDEWLYDADVSSTLDEWLGDSRLSGFDPMASLQPADKRRLRELRKICEGYGYLLKITQDMGSEWLEKSDWEAVPAYEWVKSYLIVTKQGKEKEKEEEENEEEKGEEAEEEKEEEEKKKETLESNIVEDEKPAENTADENAALQNGDSAEEADPISAIKANNSGEVSAEADSVIESKVTNGDARLSLEKEAEGPEEIEKIEEVKEVEECEGGEEDGEEQDNNEGTASSKEQIIHTLEWVAKEIDVDLSEPLTLKRIAEIYQEYGHIKEALKNYEQVLEHDTNDVSLRRKLAETYNSNGDTTRALEELDKIFETLKGRENMSAEEANSLNKDHLLYASICENLGKPQLSIPHYEKGLVSDDNSNYRDYLACLFTVDDPQRTASSVFRMVADGSPGLPSQYFVEFLLSMAETGEYPLLEESVVPIVRQVGAVDVFTKAIELAQEKTESDQSENVFSRVFLTIYKLITSILCDSSAENRMRCARELNKCSSRLFAYGDGGTSLNLRASQLSGMLYLDLAREKFGPSIVSEIEANQQNIHNSWTRFHNIRTGTYLCQFYLMQDQLEKARQLILNNVKDALELLSDDDESNDADAYIRLGDLLIRVGDDDNALAAWSLVGPTEPSKAASKTDATNDADDDDDDAEVLVEAAPPTLSGPLEYVCDGDCVGSEMPYADDFYICRYCPNVCFCAACLAKLRRGQLLMYICNGQHEFVHIPKWDATFRARLGKDKVLVGGEIQADTWERIGGEIISVSEWIKRLRESWNL